jgi:hypothetical protein
MSARTLSDLLAAQSTLYQRQAVRESMLPTDPNTADFAALTTAVLTLIAHVISESRRKGEAA